MLTITRRRLCTLAVAGLIVLAGCGSDTSTDDAEPNASNEGAVENTEAANGETAAPSPEPAAAPGGGEKSATVTIDGETIPFDLSEMCQNRGEHEMLALGTSVDGVWDFDLRYNREAPDEETFAELAISDGDAKIGWYFDVYTYGGEPSIALGEVTWTKAGSTITGEAVFVAVFSDQEPKQAQGTFSITC